MFRICSSCEKRFETYSGEKDMIKECKDNFGVDPVSNPGLEFYIVCDDCYQETMKALKN